MTGARDTEDLQILAGRRGRPDQAAVRKADLQPISEQIARAERATKALEVRLNEFARLSGSAVQIAGLSAAPATPQSPFPPGGVEGQILRRDPTTRWGVSWHSLGNAATLDVGTVAGTVAAGDDARFSDAREWTADTIGQSEAEAGTGTTRRAWTAQRVFQAIAAWWAGSAAKAKLDGIEAGAQVNVPTNLTYATGASTGAVNSSTGSGATLPAATGSIAGLLTAADKTKLDGIAAGAQVNVPTNLGYTAAASTGTVTSSTGTSATLPAATPSLAGLQTAADKTKLDGIAAGATANATDGALRDRSTHTGTQPVGTITGLGTAATMAGPSGAIVGTTDTQTLTNKTISGASNTLSDLNAGNLASGTMPSARLPASLSSIYSLTPAADRFPYYTSTSAAALATLTTFGRSLIDDADAATARTTLGLGTAATATVTTSATDATADRLLKVGDFGLGANTAPLLADIDVDTLRPGFYRTTTDTLGVFPTGSNKFGHMLVERYNAGSIKQTYQPIAQAGNSFGGATIWTRRYRNDTPEWTDWVAHYTTGNVVGTVSQSGGVPTGAVIQRGSNANGEFVRFADGTQICTKRLTGQGPVSTAAGSLFRSADINLGNWSATFIEPPNMTVTTYAAANAHAWWSQILGASITAGGFGAINRWATSASTDFVIEVTATGKWF